MCVWVFIYHVLAYTRCSRILSLPLFYFFKCLFYFYLPLFIVTNPSREYTLACVCVCVHFAFIAVRCSANVCVHSFVYSFLFLLVCV